MTQERTAEFAKDDAYESLLEEVNSVVDGWGERPGAEPRGPTLFVVGAPRSGTTLVYQVLAATEVFNYPSNLIARFYRSPAWGARVQRLLEPVLRRGAMSFSSRAGNTDGWWGPHEFGYFWEHHFDFAHHHEPEDSDLAPLVRALAAFEVEGGRPGLFKNPILGFVLGQLAASLPESRFLWVRRPHLEVAASIHRTRERFYGDSAAWLSLRPADAPDDASPAVQIAHQLGRFEGAMARLKEAHGARVAEVRYADVCAHPGGVIRKAMDLIGTQWTGGQEPPPFVPSDVAMDALLRKALKAALEARPELDPAEI